MLKFSKCFFFILLLHIAAHIAAPDINLHPQQLGYCRFLKNYSSILKNFILVFLLMIFSFEVIIFDINLTLRICKFEKLGRTYFL